MKPRLKRAMGEAMRPVEITLVEVGGTVAQTREMALGRLSKVVASAD